MNLILFDLDGTLYDARPILPGAYEKGITKLNKRRDRKLDVPSEDKIMDQIGTPADEIYDNLFPTLNPEERKILQEWILNELVHGIRNEQGRLMEGIPEILKELNNKNDLNLVTNGQRIYMEAILETYRLDSFFRGTYCIDDSRDGEKSDLVRQALNQTGANSDEALMVGDRQSDLRAAETMGLRFVGIEDGYGSKQELSGQQTVKNPGELLKEIPLNQS